MAIAAAATRALACYACLSTFCTVVTLAASRAVDCETVPTWIETTDYSLPFEVPLGLMPDRQFDGLPAHLEVHRVRPVYADKCPSLTTKAAVLVHGRTVTGPVAFDLRFPAPGGGTLSAQKPWPRRELTLSRRACSVTADRRPSATASMIRAMQACDRFRQMGHVRSPKDATPHTIRSFR